MKVIVTGSAGRLGGALVDAYRDTYKVIGLARGELDLSSPESVDSVLRGLDFDVLVNCAALTNVDYCETHADEAHLVNATAVGRMAGICKAKGARLIHISTDYVFGGKKKEELTEDDKAEPLGVYGESKLVGERLVTSCDSRFLCVRVSWVFGPHRPSFVDMILRRALENEHVEAIGDKYSSPAYSLDLAEYLKPLIETGGVGGVLHLCNAGGTTWREYGEYALGVAAECGVPLKTTRVGSIGLKDLKNFIAERPVHTILSTDKFTSRTGVRPRPWREAVREYVERFAAPALLGG